MSEDRIRKVLSTIVDAWDGAAKLHYDKASDGGYTKDVQHESAGKAFAYRNCAETLRAILELKP